MATAASSVIVPVSDSGSMEASHEGGSQNLEGHAFNKDLGMRCTASEIEEESMSDLFEIGQSGASASLAKEEDLFEGSLFSYDIHRGGEVEEEDSLYVAVGKDESSMDALTWALRSIPADKAMTTTFYLVHVFPETHSIPSPLGNLPISSVSGEQVETHKARERSKRREMLQKYVDTCKASSVKVDTILIESDMASKAILDLIPVLNIRRMVLGTTKSNLRYVNGKRLLLGRTDPSRPDKEKCNDLEEILFIRRLRSKKGNEITEILQKTPETCEIKIICEGKEVVLDGTIVESPTTVTRGSEDGSKSIQLQQQEENQCGNYFSCVCFKPKTLN